MKNPFLSAVGFLWRRYRRERWGAAAAEFAIILPILAIPILNAVDIAIYAYDRMEVNNAAQTAAQAAWATCAVAGYVPATPNNNCAALTTNAASAAQNTAAIGMNVTCCTITEDFACPVSGSLQQVAGNFPSNGPTVCSSGEISGDYVFVTASYTYSPIFTAVSVASFFSPTISKTAAMRLE